MTEGHHKTKRKIKCCKHPVVARWYMVVRARVHARIHLVVLKAFMEVEDLGWHPCDEAFREKIAAVKRWGGVGVKGI